MSSVNTPEEIEGLRWITIRMALRMEIQTGMKRSSRGRSTLALANEITGQNCKTKKAAYKALDDMIVARGISVSKPL